MKKIILILSIIFLFILKVSAVVTVTTQDGVNIEIKQTNNDDSVNGVNYWMEIAKTASYNDLLNHIEHNANTQEGGSTRTADGIICVNGLQVHSILTTPSQGGGYDGGGMGGGGYDGGGGIPPTENSDPLCPSGNCITTTPTWTPPIPTITTSYGGTCSSYIANWIPNWTNCEINSNWTNNGTINCLQKNIWAPVSNSCGATVNIETCSTDKDGNTSCSSSSYCDTSSCQADAPRPQEQQETKTVISDLDTPKTICSGDNYANNKDDCVIRVNISGNTNQNKDIVGLVGKKVINIVDKSNYPSNRINGVFNEINNNALNFSQVTSDGIKGSGTNFYIDISGVKSRAPLNRTDGKVEVTFQGFDNYTTITKMINNISYNFKKPFIGEVKTSKNNGLTWDAKPTIGTQLTYKVYPLKMSDLGFSQIDNYSLNNFVNEIKADGTQIETQASKVDLNSLNDYINGTKFYSRLNTTSQANTLNQTPGIKLDLPIISYKLDGHDVKYYLSSKDLAEDITPISTIGNKFVGIKIIGNSQTAGKAQITGQIDNISTLAPQDLRTQIRKNAYNYTKSMKSGDIVNGVKFVKGDITISGDLNYETLVVLDGNVIISGNLNTSKKKLGIIVLKDNYNTDIDFNNGGNIYINPNVNYINSVIYADGGMISSDNSGKAYTTDSSQRTSELDKQLYLVGNIFTRNTIGGAILAGGNYILPGGLKIGNSQQDFDKAMIYDLNYIRRGNEGCDKNNNGNCSDSGEFIEPFILKYDSNILLNPPKLFSN